MIKNQKDLEWSGALISLKYMLKWFAAVLPEETKFLHSTAESSSVSFV